MLLCRILFRFDSVQGYSHRLDGLFESLRPRLHVEARRYFEEEASIFANVLAEGPDDGWFACDDPLAVAHTMLLATNSLLPYSLNAQELGCREEVEISAERIADLLLNGIKRCPPSSRAQRKSPELKSSSIVFTF